jgi:tetratricopeptide (TPR) repeat protein
MKSVIKKYAYGALVLFCAAFALFIFINSKNKQEWPALKMRQGALAEAPEWAGTREKYQQLTATLEKKPQDATTLLQLAKLFMQEARATGDNTYYNQHAMQLIQQVLGQDARHFEATCLKAMILLSQHRFQEGKSVAEAACAINPYNAFVHGLLVDALVETGDYPAAVAMGDKMVAIRPDIRSYSRVSYLREIHGQLPGAIEAIKMAIGAGYPGNEDTEWARMVLGHLYEDCDSLDKAMEQYQQALEERPDYPFALAGLARIARYRGDAQTAIQYLDKAYKVMPEVGFLEELAAAWQATGNSEKATEILNITIKALETDSRDPQTGHLADMELATLYLQSGQVQKALEHARTEYQRRPQNIDAAMTLAWVLYRNGQSAEALPLAQTALKTGSQQPERLLKCGLILQANGQKAAADTCIATALRLKPYMDAELRQMAGKP